MEFHFKIFYWGLAVAAMEFLQESALADILGCGTVPVSGSLDLVRAPYVACGLNI